MYNILLHIFLNVTKLLISMDKKTIFKVIKCSNQKESVIRSPAAGKVAFLNSIKLYVHVVTLSAKEIKKISKFLGNGVERSVYWNEYKTKTDNKNTTSEYRYFFLVYLNWNNYVKRSNALKYY